ncbi:MAG: hypothetical protein Q7K34_04730 [archaeon]|nr:hypothetical protein [archaeon]
MILGVIRKNKSIIVALIIFFGILLFLVRNLDFSKMWAFGDLISYPTDLKITFNWVFSAWRDEGLGLFNFPAINYYLIIFFSSLLFGSFFAQKILFLSTLIIAFTSSFLFLKYFGFKTKSSFLGGFFYAINPVTISSFVGGAIGELMTFAVLPLVLIYLHKSLSSEKLNFRHIAFLGLLSLFLWNTYVFFWQTILIIAPFVLFASQKYKTLSRMIPLVVVLTVFFLPTLLGILNLNKGIFEEKISFESTVKYTYKDISVLNLLRLSGNTGSAQAEEFLNYNNIGDYTVLGYILFLLTIIALFFAKKQYLDDSITSIPLIVASITLIVAIGLLLLVKMYPNLIDVNPLISTLRNPVKLMYLLVFAFSILFTYSIQKLLSKIEKNKLTQNTVMACIILVILLSNYPALDGTLGIQKVRSDQYFIEEDYYKLSEILKGIDQHFTDSRLLILPWEYPTNLRIRSELPNYFGTPLGAQLGGSNISAIKNVFDSIHDDEKTKSIVLGIFNVKYIVVKKNFKSYYLGQKWYEHLKNKEPIFVYNSHNSYWVSGDPLKFYSIFYKDNNFELIYEDESFTIFKNLRYSDKFFTLPTKNLIKNPYFEDGLNQWKNWPSHTVNIESCKELNEGRSCAVLSSQKKEFTILYQLIPAEENKWYTFSFAINPSIITDAHAKLIWYDQTEKTGESDGIKVDYIKFNKMSIDTKKWAHINEAIESPADTKLVRIQFLGNRSLENGKITLGNISVLEVPQQINKEIQSSTHELNYISNFEKINPTRYKVSVKSNKPFMLVFSESYDPFWVAYTKDVESIKPVQVYSVINGFWVDQIGEFEIIVEYMPQRWFYIVSIIEIFTILGIVMFLFYSGVKNKKIKTIEKATRSEDTIPTTVPQKFQRWKHDNDK